MFIHEHVAMGMVKERMADAMRIAEQRRAMRASGAPRSTRIRVGRSLVRLGYWVLGQRSPALS
jgi:hypothetical protein